MAVYDQKSAYGMPLSPREVEVYNLLVEGKSYRQIAVILGLALQTVRNHLHAIYEKVGVQSNVELVIKHWRDGWRPMITDPPCQR